MFWKILGIPKPHLRAYLACPAWDMPALPFGQRPNVHMGQGSHTAGSHTACGVKHHAGDEYVCGGYVTLRESQKQQNAQKRKKLK